MRPATAARRPDGIDGAAPGWQVLDWPDADIAWHADRFASAGQAWLHALWREAAWRQHSLRLFGRRLRQPRLTAWHGDFGVRYAYSGLRLEALEWTPCMSRVRHAVEAELRRAGWPDAAFNSVLMNYYRDGDDSMGWHSDDEPELGERPLIASLSLGAARRFALRHRHRSLATRTLRLGHGALLVMAGDTQRHWRHCAPKTRRPVGPRLNLTFRRILGPASAPPLASP